MKRRRDSIMKSSGTSCCRPCWLLLSLAAVAVGATAATDARTHHQYLARLPLRATFARRQRGDKSFLFADGGVGVDLSILRGGGDDGPEDEAAPATSADVEPPVEVDDTKTSAAEEANDTPQSDDSSKGEKLEKMAYSLSGITRKVNDEDSDGDDDASTSAVPDDDIAESAVDSDMPEKQDEPSGDEQPSASLDVLPDKSEQDVAIADDSDDATSKPSSPLADLSNQLHHILLRHRMHSEEESKEVTKLRDLILERCEEYMDDIHLYAAGESKKKPRHPRKLLHFLAPKVPAIKQSPDITLRIKSAKADWDGSAAAYAIGSIACMTELFDRHASTLENQESEEEDSKSKNDDDDDEEEDAGKSESLAAGDIISDRRLEQLTECVLSSIDAKTILQKIDREDDGEKSVDEISPSLDPADSLSVQDAAYAAFGLALLGARDLGKLGGYKPREVFSILSLHCRDVLLAKEKQMKSKDVESVQDVVNDVSTALWAFSCVKSICGYRSDDLFDTCCSILLLQEAALNQTVSEADEPGDADDKSGNIAVGNSTIESETTANVTGADSSDLILPRTIESSVLNQLGHRQLINCLWALAIHGSSDNKALHWNEDTSGSSQTASETSEDLADLLLERVGCLLGDEIGRLAGENEQEGQNEKPPSSPGVENQNSDTEQNSETDAETRGAFNDNQGNSTSINGVQEMLCDNKEVGNGAPGDGEVIQVISAAAILEEEARQRQDDAEISKREKSKSDKKSGNDSDKNTSLESVRQEEEASEPPNETDDSSAGAREEEQVHLSEATPDETASPSQPQLSISDMCSIAWAATELGREASVDIVWRITILFCYSREDVTAVDGTSLSNLAYAIAKNLEASNGSKLKPHIKTIVDWIAESSLKILSKQPRYLSKTATGKFFQPPELSRLLWSLSLIKSAETGVLSGGGDTADRNPVLAALAAEAMRITSYDLPVFSVEDLARILWAFTELGDTTSEVDILSGSTVQSFGRIQETIEASLLRWESGQKNVTASQQHKEGGLFSRLPSTFFGRARSRRLSLLDLKISDDEDDEDEDSTSSSKPALKDLTVDPATLSKLCFGLAQVSRNHQQIIGSEQILRVASRLFSSKNGRLLSECSHKDVIRMCCACVDTMKLAGKELRGSDREFVLRQFPRRVVQLINTPLPDGRSYLDDLSPEDLSAMLFALGELGVKASISTESPETEHRRLRMVPSCPVLPEEILDSLSLTSVSNLVSGIIAIGDTTPRKKALAKAMANLQHRIDAVGSGESYLLCRLAAALSRLLRAPVPTSIGNSNEKKKRHSADNEIVNDSDESAGTAEEKVIENLSPESSLSSEDDDKSPNDGASAKREHEEIRKEARHLLGLVLEQAAARIGDMSGEQIRRILLHVVLLPQQADEFIEAAETEVHKRLSALDADAEAAGFGSLEELSQQTADAAIDIATSLSTSSPGDSGEGPFKFLKKGGKARDLAAEANRAAASACEAAARLDRIHRGAHLKGEEILHQIEQGAAFELGRCLTLLERYQRIEFTEDNFSRRSRYDDERRKIIGKRVCSRLFS